jgi:hypothetical protein
VVSGGLLPVVCGGGSDTLEPEVSAPLVGNCAGGSTIIGERSGGGSNILPLGFSATIRRQFSIPLCTDVWCDRTDVVFLLDIVPPDVWCDRTDVVSLLDIMPHRSRSGIGIRGAVLGGVLARASRFRANRCRRILLDVCRDRE